ncbi:phospholipase D-like domain-containing protein [Ferrovum sp.]|uniref:phospholipase D-like domain-containing protein n=1 Tax=Ferrovum sp. TaxID=2609467 RepID=UPI002601E850|nr:phospholipase D-like domain-containing protein [Ferrovum sp.]
MGQLRLQLHEALKVLSAHSAAGSLICSAVSDGQFSGTMDVRRICSLSGIAQARTGEALSFLMAAKGLGLVEQISGLNWRVAQAAILAELAPMLQAIHVYRTEIHQDADTVEVVLTKPLSPSQLAKSLEGMLLGTWGLLDTREILPSIAENASERFVVMTPFLDEVGGEILLALFQHVRPSVRKQLIIRAAADGLLPAGYLAIAGQLYALGVEAFNFRLDKENAFGMETFHAKVVLADNAKAYVGSSNMNKWSFQYSLELGLLVSGKAASRISQVIDAVTCVSARLVY